MLAAQAVLETLDLIPLPRDPFRSAGLLEPPALRTLDSLHLSAALALGHDLDGLVTYDAWLADAARGHALSVEVPV